MPKYTENDLQNAIKDVTAGVSVRAASRSWGVPRTTIQSRMYGHLPRSYAFEPWQRLSQAQERDLAGWIITQGRCGFAPTHQQVREIAYKVASAQGDTRPIGQSWVEGFLQRNPTIKSLRNVRIDVQRVESVTQSILRNFFALAEQAGVGKTHPSLLFNMDETGLMEGEGTNGIALGAAEKRVIYSKKTTSRVWTTIIECVSAGGLSLPPLVIFKGKSVQKQWFPSSMDCFEGWQFTATENGWTSYPCGTEWLLKVFIPGTQGLADSLGSNRILVLDGHGSHCTDDFLYECFKAGIYLLFLPAHSSHITQPLDLAVFGPLKQAYRRNLQQLEGYTAANPIGKAQFLELYAKARRQALSPQNIKAGWRATGLSPFCSNRVLRNPMVQEDPAPQAPSTPQKPCKTGLLRWETPRSSAELRHASAKVLGRVQLGDEIRGSVKRLFDKAGKALDRRIFETTQLQLQARALTAQIGQLQPRRKGKVAPDPNSRFAGIEAIKRAQLKGEALIEVSTTLQHDQEAEFESLCSQFYLE